jgi:hypothetical protein
LKISSNIWSKLPNGFTKEGRELESHVFFSSWMKSERAILIALKILSFCVFIIKASKKKNLREELS